MTMKHLLGKSTRSTITQINEDSVQPNAIDITIDRLFEVLPTTFWLGMNSNETKHRELNEVEIQEDGYFKLEKDKTYQFLSDSVVEVGDSEAGYLITRSSLNRNGLVVTSGLYDSGFEGHLGGLITVGVGSAYVKRGARVAQFILFDAEMVHSYDGSYGIVKDEKLYR